MTLLNVYTTIYYYVFLKTFIPMFFSAAPPVPSWLDNERTFFTIWWATAAAVLVSFVLIALSIVHAWRYSRLSQTGKVIWSIVPFFFYQPGLLAYWVWNVARPAVQAGSRPSA